ncbi:hypothetical protein [Microbacterium oleivorans]|uniref:Uncharacterized protein n=1 Tax=Microbacterium oleivorans TaxID=273677 RepID=A0A4V6PNH0_9MICO|nr:hypothetical protein [Microbacterium oleivorans]TDL43850.1 hypothetical protein E2R54_11715 [Microbacterium oleivorans]
MTRLEVRELDEFLSAWLAEPKLPLVVSRAQYDVPSPRSWEVMYDVTPTYSVPIAEFTEWAEAQQWADAQSRWAVTQGAEVRRYRLDYWPDGGWGGVGYFDAAGDYHELPAPSEEEQ